MSWSKWFSEYKVPKVIDRLVSAGILQDRTRHYDIVPHFEAILSDGSELVLWSDHPDVTLRALPEGPRYGIEIYRKGELPKTVFESNEIEETVEALKGILKREGGLRSI